MKQLRKVLTQTTWANASDAINKNSDRIYEAITRVENATTKNKGYFETSNALLDTYPNPSVGDIAFVFNLANNIDTPYDVYKAEFSSTTNKYEWYDSGINAPFADVDINSVNDSIIDIEQQVDTLKDPRLPIICDANGRLGLNVGNGLYVDSNGDLCATQSIGGGGSGSGGETYYAAGGISINEDNFISVKKDASLEFDNDNALRVGTGEGLVHNSSGKLSVNVGKGLVINDKTNTVEVEGYDAIKELPIAIQKKQDRLIKGSGIDITSENIINVDGSNLHVLLSTNAINDGVGNNIVETYATKNELNNKQDTLTFGSGISEVNNVVTIADSINTDISTNKQNIAKLQQDVASHDTRITYLEQNGGGGGSSVTFTEGDGIDINEGKVSVRIGTGLGFDPLSSAVVVKVGAGVETDINQALTIKHDTTLTTDAEGQLGVNQGTITDIAATEVAKVVANAPANYDTLKEIADYIATDAEGAAQLSNRIGALESELPNKMDAIAFGSGLAFSSNTVSVDIGDGLVISTNKVVARIQSKPVENVVGDVDVAVGARYQAGEGVTITDNIIKVKDYQTMKDDLNNKQDKIDFSDGLTFSNDTLRVSTQYLANSLAGSGLKVGDSGIEVDSSVLNIPWTNISDRPSSLPANGGSAYTSTRTRYIETKYDGSDLWSGDSYRAYIQWEGATARLKVDGYNTSVNYANNAGDADTLDGHDSSYFATASALDNKQDKLTFGNGLSETNGTLKVNASELASSNLDVTTEGKLTVGTNTIKNIAGNGLKANNQQLDLDTSAFAKVATSGSYNDLSNKPTIPSAVTESTVSGWGFTKNTGTYSKPSGGIPKSDLNSSVQTTLGNADTAYGWGYHGIAGYAKKVKVGDKTYEADSNAVVSLPAYPTSLPASDVSAWAKASTKPSYTKAEVGLGNVDNTADSQKSVKYATSATNDSDGNAINTTYLKTTGGNITGNLTLYQYLRIRALEGYGTGNASAWYDGNNLQLLWGGVSSMWINDNELALAKNIPTFSTGFSTASDGSIALSTSYIAQAITGDGLTITDKGITSKIQSKEVSGIVGDVDVAVGARYSAGEGIQITDNIIKVKDYQSLKDGINGKQDVLTFQGGFLVNGNIVQLKLSTGLAIDELGCLYVKG